MREVVRGVVVREGGGSTLCVRPAGDEGVGAEFYGVRGGGGGELRVVRGVLGLDWEVVVGMTGVLQS